MDYRLAEGVEGVLTNNQAMREDPKKVFFVLWCPTAPMPPRVRFPDLKKAEEVAKDMAQKHGQDFFVLKAVSLSQRALPPVKTTKLK